MENLKLSDVHPFVRKVGFAFGLKHGQPMKAYDYRLIFFCDGGKLWVEDEAFDLEAWSVAMIAPGVAYRIQLQKTQRIIVINFDLTGESRGREDEVLFAHAERFEKDKIVSRERCAALLPEKGYLLRRANKTVFQLCNKMSRDYLHMEKNEARMLLLSGTLMEVFGELLRDEQQKNEKAQKIYQYICENFQNDITLDELSQRFNYHKTYINRLLKTEYRACFKQLVIELRLSQAMVLLEETDMSLTEIANSLGFYDSKHLGHSFKKRYGINPSAYRG